MGSSRVSAAFVACRCSRQIDRIRYWRFRFPDRDGSRWSSSRPPRVPTSVRARSRMRSLASLMPLPGSRGGSDRSPPGGPRTAERGPTIPGRHAARRAAVAQGPRQGPGGGEARMRSPSGAPEPFPPMRGEGRSCLVDGAYRDEAITPLDAPQAFAEETQKERLAARVCAAYSPAAGPRAGPSLAAVAGRGASGLCG